jgi:hypothetical protein
MLTEPINSWIVSYTETGLEEIKGGLLEADFGGVSEISFVRLRICNPA